MANVLVAGPEIDTVTQAWIRNPADRKAAAKGCRFDVGRGSFVVEWIERYCRLYEGEWAGEPLVLRGCLDCGYDREGVDLEERARRHVECVAAGHNVSWQYDCTMRLFGWVRYSQKWDREVRRFRQASVFVAKKNTKSPTISAWGWYLLCGDGEPGQKVFLAAKDGKQARGIMGEHVLAMLEQSPELREECSINRSTMRVTHHPSRSWMEPLSSSNARTQKSKEGLNGSVLIDEVHVVDRDFVRRLNRAGISRSEPLHIEVSTAGNDPDSYGKERFDYALRVEKGDTEDQELFVAIYAAPQDLTEADLDKDLLKCGRMANPAMGHTVDPEEYLRDYERSKQSIQAMLDFMMYRLNVWQRSANPWLKADDWARCYRRFDEDSLSGRRCWAALDLSRTRDMSALVLVFHGDEAEEFLLLPYFWLPEERARAIEPFVPDVVSWKQSGSLIVTSGGVTDYGFIKAKFRQLADRFDIQKLIYDPKYAEELTQSLEQGETDDKGNTLATGTGVPRLAFPQTDLNFATPTADFERLVIAGKLHHNGHPVLTWQASHATVLRRPMSGIIRVFKPASGNTKTVDGIVAGIMGLCGAMAEPEDLYIPGELWE